VRTAGGARFLPALGIADTFLTGRNCPCPMCGGTDRFRFLVEYGGDGLWLCNQCQPKPRPAIDLAMAFTGKPFLEAVRAIDDILGDRRAIPQTSIRPPQDDTGKTIQYKKTWRRGFPVRRNDVVDRYLCCRGVGMDIYPPCLRTSELDWYLEKHPDFLPQDGFVHNDWMYRVPAMFAAVTNPEGKHVATHRTFLAEDGQGKANLSKPRLVAGKFGSGPTIRLMPPAPLMGISEGIETALSAAKLFRLPVWSVLYDGGIASFEPPPKCRHLIIFADHDKNGTSQRAAEALRNRLDMPVEIKMPVKVDADWNDVLVESSR
jgi:putative DNA primase/helicase